MRNYQSAFARLGSPEMQKQALEWGGLGQTMKGWGNQISSGVQGALQSTKSNLAGTGALLTGKGFQGAADAANQSWNNSGKNIAATDNRAAAHHATAGAMAEKNQASFARPVNTAIDAAKGMFGGGFNGMANAANDSWNKGTAVINDQQNIIANSQKAIGANSPGAVTPPTAAPTTAPAPPPTATPAPPPAGGLPGVRNDPRFKSHFQRSDQKAQKAQMDAAGVTSGQFIGGELVRPGQPLSAHQQMVQGISTSMGNPPVGGSNPGQIPNSPRPPTPFAQAGANGPGFGFNPLPSPPQQQSPIQQPLPQ